MRTSIQGLEAEIIQGLIVGKANHYQVARSGSNGVGNRIIKDKAVRNYEKSFARQCRIYQGINIDVPFTLFVRVYYDHNNHDLDNSLKTLLDCLQYVHAIANDNLCMRINAEKAIDKNNPRVVFAIQPHQGDLFK